MPHFRGAARDGIEHLEGRDQFAGGIDFDLQAACAHLLYVADERVDPGTEPWEIGRPCSDQFPAETLL